MLNRLTTPDALEKPSSGLTSSLRAFLLLLVAPLAQPMEEGSGVRAMASGAGVRAGVPGQLASMKRPTQVAESGGLRLTVLLVLVAAACPVLAQTSGVNPAELRRITSRDTPAHRAATRYLRGTNLGNYLEAPPGQDWGAHYSEQDFIHVKAEGFDHVRLPVAWHHYAGGAPEFKLSNDIFAKADFLVTNAQRWNY